MYNITSKLLRRDGLAGKISARLSPEEINQRLDDNDKTYINSDISFDPLSFKTVVSERRFSIKSEPDQIKDLISKTKKINRFYYHHVDILKRPISYLVKLMDRAQYYPDVFKSTKCTILPARIIYSMDAIPKIIEGVFYNAFQECINEDYLANGDSYQMAYEKHRGVALCNAIAIIQIEHCLKFKKMACIKFTGDYRKRLTTHLEMS